MATYTVEQARDKWEKAGETWTPEVEATLRSRGIIAQPAAPAAPAAAPAGGGVKMPWWQEALLAAGEFAGNPVAMKTSRAIQQGLYGSSGGEQVLGGAVSGLTAGQITPDEMGIPAPATTIQKGLNLAGQGGGMAVSFIPIARGAGALTAGIANPLLRAGAAGAASFGAYNAAAPAESVGDWAKNVGEGALTGAALGPLPLLPGVRNVAALPGGRTAVDLAGFTGLGMVHGQEPGQAFVEALPQLAAMRLVHGATAAPREAAPKAAAAEASLEALDARLTAEQAAAMPEVTRRAAAFREARSAAQEAAAQQPAPDLNRLAGGGVLPPRGNAPEVDAAARARTEAIQAESAARQQAEYEAQKAFEADFRQRMEAERQRRLAEEAAVPPRERPVQPEIKYTDDSTQYSRTKARIEAMQARRAQMQQPDLSNSPVILRRPDGTLEPMAAPEGVDIGTGTPPEKPVFTGPVIDGEPSPGTPQEAVRRFNYEGTLRDAAERRAARETRGERRARLQAEASQVNAEAQAKLNAAASRGEVTTDMLGSQQIYEAVAKVVSEAGRRAKNTAAAAKADWSAAREELSRDVAESPLSVPFSRHQRGEQSFEDAVTQVASAPRRVKSVDNLRPYPENATEGVREIIDAENLSALRQDIGKAVADRIDAGFTKELAEKQVGLTDPVRKSQEVSDGELASAIEMSEIHGGREIEMSAAKKAAELAAEYRDLKKRTGMMSPKQLEIAGQLLENYTSRNRGHVGDDLAFVRDPANRQLLLDSGNPEGMLEYVKGVRAQMDAVGNLYDTLNRGLGGPGLGDIAAYFPKVPQRPKFFDVRERVERAKARKGADPRTRNTAEGVFNPRSERRSSTDPNKVELDGREVPREWNAETVLEGYIDTMLRAISGDVALSQSIKTAKYMEIKADAAERKGNDSEAQQLRIRANIIRNLAQQKWNHQLFGFGARAEDAFKAFGTPGSVALEAVAANKRAFDNTKYRLNPRFNLVTQWTSVLNPFMADPVAGILALRDMGVPGVPNEAKKFAEATYEARRKNMPHSQMRAQIEGTGSVASAISAPTSPARKFANAGERVFFDGMTQGIEAWANKYSALIGYHSTRNLKGLTPRQRALAAGQNVFKTQSAFTFGERAGVLNSRAVQGLAPAQGYAVELANQIREALGRTGVDSKLYGETATDQHLRAGRIVAAAVMQNIWQNLVFNWMRGKDPAESLNFDSVWDATIALPPFIGLILPTGKGGRDMPNPVLPVAQFNAVVNKGGKVVENVAEGKDATGAAVDLMRYGVGNWGGPGGAFASDLMGGRYDSLMGEDNGTANVPNTVRSRPVAPRTSRGRQAIPRR